MVLVSTSVFLRGHGGECPTGTSFFELMDVRAGDGFKLLPSDSPWQAALITLVEVAIEDCLKAAEPWEEFAVRINSGLKNAAKWLLSGRDQRLAAWRQSGRMADVVIGGWLEDNQFDFVFPPEFLLACGSLGLQITISTND